MISLLLAQVQYLQTVLYEIDTQTFVTCRQRPAREPVCISGTVLPERSPSASVLRTWPPGVFDPYRGSLFGCV